jgi:hypothetical protein
MINKDTKIQIPQSLEEAISHVKEKISKFVEDQLAKSKTEDDIASSMHFGYGMWIRNNWGLWTQDSCLFKELSALGLFHADDMSSLILKCAVLDLVGKDRDIPGIVKFYKDYWKIYNNKKN